MPNEAHVMLVRGVVTAKARDANLARRCLLRALELDPTAGQREKPGTGLAKFMRPD
jgi:hypothetical protein